MRRPLRIAALAILAVSLAAGLWLLLGAPGLSNDPYYAAAHARHLLPFAGTSAAVALLVFVAGGAARSRGRWARLGLWLALIGAFLITASLVGQLGVPATYPRRYPQYDQAYLTQLLLLSLAGVAGVLSLIAGGVLWLLSYRLDRRRPA